jgi:glycerol kinase
LVEIRVDGGMARSDPFLQFQADLLGLPIHRSPNTESTSLGAALLAGIGANLWPDPGAAIEILQAGGRDFQPSRDQGWRELVSSRWRRAVDSVIALCHEP